MSAPALRPLRVGEVLDAGIRVYLRNLRTLMGLAAFVVVPLQVLDALVLLSSVSSPSQVPRGGFSVTNPTAMTASDRAASLGATAVTFLIGLIITLLTTAACVKAVSDFYLGERADLRSSLRFAVRRAPVLLWQEILVLLGMTVGVLLLVVPAIWLYVAWSVATPVLLIDGLGGRRALGRSRRLVRGRWWPTAGVLAVANVMVFVVSAAIQGLLFVVLGTGGSTAVAILTTAVTASIAAIVTRPFFAAVSTVLYYDLRVRHEGFDVALLAQQLGIPQLRAGVSLPSTGPESVGTPGGPPFWPPPPGCAPGGPALGRDAAAGGPSTEHGV